MLLGHSIVRLVALAALGVAGLAMSACCPPSSITSRAASSNAAPAPVKSSARPCSAGGAAPALAFERSPGGTPDVSPDVVHDHLCQLTIVDVRERHELVAELGHIEGARWVPLRELAREAERWDRQQAWVLVDRSGRRSGRAARYLVDLGFPRVASMTGGMLAWEKLGYATSRAADFGAGMVASAAKPQAAAMHSAAMPLTSEDVEIHVGAPSQVRWTKAATLLTHGTESCVDGRDDHAVVGTPGGDAGELLAALATAEALTAAPLRDAEVERLFGDYVEAFGHFYMHSDEQALQRLGEELRADPRFARWHAGLGDLQAVEAFVRQPPTAAQEALLEHLLDPSTIGCGHLRLVRLHPEDYEVRPALMDAVFGAYFHRLWHGAEELEFVVLRGEHEEGAVLDVRLDSAVQPFSAIPMISPRHNGREMFVNHPQVASFIRRQNASFLLGRSDWAKHADLDQDLFLERLEGLAKRQLTHTLRHLAADLPVFEVRFVGKRFEVEKR